jgi:hypothetical protein
MNMRDLDVARLGLEEMLENIDNGRRIHEQLVSLAADYLGLRVAWGVGDVEKRLKIDEARSRAHDAFLTLLNAATRRAAGNGHSLEWRNPFSLLSESEERKSLGDFACYLAFYAALVAR